MIEANGRKRQVHQYTLNGEYVDSFESLSDAHRKLGVKVGQLSKFLYGEADSAGGYLWSEEKVDKMKPYQKKDPAKEITVHQYDLSGNYLATFRNYKEIADSLDISMAKAYKVDRCCKGLAQSAHGFQWRHIKSNVKIAYKGRVH